MGLVHKDWNNCHGMNSLHKILNNELSRRLSDGTYLKIPSQVLRQVQ